MVSSNFIKLNKKPDSLINKLGKKKKKYSRNSHLTVSVLYNEKKMYYNSTVVLFSVILDRTEGNMIGL